MQRAAEAVYSEQGKKEIKQNIEYYLTNAKIIRDGLSYAGMTLYGGVNAPYIWVKTPRNTDSWTFFDQMLTKCNVVVTPGVGFGPQGEGYVRMTAFGNRDNCVEAVKRISKIFG